MAENSEGTQEQSSEAEESRGKRRADMVFAGTAVGGLLAIALLYRHFPAIMGMLLIAGLLSYALLPLVDRLDQKMNRTAAVLIIALLAMGLLVGTGILLFPTVAQELTQLPKIAESTVELVKSFLVRLSAVLPAPVWGVIQAVGESLWNAINKVSPSSISSAASTALTGIAAVASSIVFLPVLIFLMLRSYHPMVKKIASMIPPRWKPRFEARIKEADLVLSGFIRGQLLVAFVLALTYGIGFSLVGIPLGAVVGLLAGFAELIPFLGSIIAVVFGTLLALVGGKPTDALWVIGIYFVVQALQGALLSPIVLGQQARIGPVAVIVSLAVGANLFGIIGMLLAVPVAGLIKVATRAAAHAYCQSNFFLREAP